MPRDLINPASWRHARRLSAAIIAIASASRDVITGSGIIDRLCTPAGVIVNDTMQRPLADNKARRRGTVASGELVSRGSGADRANASDGSATLSNMAEMSVGASHRRLEETGEWP